MAGRRGKTACIVAAIAVVAVVAVFVFAGNRQAARPPADFQQATVDYVIDGDTIDVMLDGHEKRVRLAGIDAPESASHDEGANSEEGARATEYLRSLLPQGRTVYLLKDSSETDKYGRLVRYVWLEIPGDPTDPGEVASKMANAVIVEAGFAQAIRVWPDVAYTDDLKAAQERAVAAGAGVSYLWRDGAE